MSVIPPPKAEFAAVAPPALAAWLAGELERLSPDSPLVVIAGEPSRVLFATPAALVAFHAASLKALDLAALGGDGPTARRLRHLAATLGVGAPPRLEALRVARGRATATLVLHCARFRVVGFGDALLLWAPPRDDRAEAAETPAPPPTAAPPPSADLGAASEDGPPTARFVWSLDDEERFGERDPALAAALGENAPAAGEALPAYRARIGAEHLEALARALASGETFSDIAALLPAVRGRQRLVRFFAAPAFDRERRQAGFRGFGLIEGESEAPGHVAEPLAEDSSADSAKSAAVGGIAPPAGSEPPATPAAPEAMTPAADSDVEGSIAVNAEAPLPASQGEAPSAPSAGEAAPLADDPSAIDPAQPQAFGDGAPGAEPAASPTEAPAPEPAAFEALGEEVARLIADRAKAENGAPTQGAPPQPNRERGGEVVPLRPQIAHFAPDNVVPIRPGALDVLAPIASDRNAAPANGDSVELTISEREAFREIARALKGGREAERADPAPPAAFDPGAVNPVAAARDVLDLAFANSSAASAKGRRDARAGEPLNDNLARNAAGVLAKLPIGVLVTREAKAIYLNQTLLDLVGYHDFQQFLAADGLSKMFRGRDPQALTPADAGGTLPLVKADGEVIAVDGHAQAIVWDGARRP